jgi:hypothetical protein
VASNMQEALDARAKLASPARQEDEERDEKRLSKADWTARATSSATFSTASVKRRSYLSQSHVCFRQFQTLAGSRALRHPARRCGGGCDFDGSSPARLEPRVVQHGSPVTSRPVNHAEPHETSRPAQSLRCSWTVLTARENETNTSGLYHGFGNVGAVVFAQF